MTYPTRPTLVDGDLRLRAPKSGDVEARMRLGNTPEIVHMFGGDPDKVQPVTLRHAERWVEQHETLETAWMIEHESALVGSLRLHSVNANDPARSIRSAF